MNANQIDTSYTNFGFLLDDLRSSLHKMHGFIDNMSPEDFARNNILSKALLGAVNQMTCLIRDMEGGRVDYTQNASVVVSVTDKDVFMQVFRKTYVAAVNAIDEYYLHKLYMPLWVCRQTCSNGKNCWSLSNICNEVSMLLSSLSQTSTICALSAHVVQN